MKSVITNLKAVGTSILAGVLALVFLPTGAEGDSELSATPSIIAVFVFLALIWFVILCIFKALSTVTRAAKSVVTDASSNRQLKKKMLEVLSDGIISEEEESELRAIADELGITQEQYEEVRVHFLNKDISHILSRIRETKRYSPQDEKELKEVTDAHRVKATFEDELFLRYRQLWEIEETGSVTLKPIPVNIRLAKAEECYFSAPAVWKQEKRVREHKGYVGGSLGFRVAKGVTLRMGRAVPVYDEYEDISEISTGTLYVTNKKLVFLGEKKSTNITFGRLANYQLYRDAIQVNKTSGRPDIFSLDEDDVMFLDALLQVL